MKDRTKLSASMKSAVMLAIAAVAVGMTALSVTSLSDNSTSVACVCDGNTNYNPTLPANHPNNRCAQQGDNVSWGNWLTGKSRSSQFHFLDLLELLHGHHERPIDDVNPTSQQNRY
ncbi:hypothetical protein [Shewanella psychrotolerans]|uniref:hypothetical protein n=1 Tax=Shewanella psychrotolerans TaxID=2864206 RepID=UPI001C65F6F2|nr:hypothetical protein [Shewanella psychrotolerans]QYK01614.1 hypothetical protein K0I62_01065 [Shewanella psychrotolerans]